MRIHAEFIEDDKGDLVDISWYCSAQCYNADNPTKDADGHWYPNGTETDYDEHCAHCGTLLWKGLQTT